MPKKTTAVLPDQKGLARRLTMTDVDQAAGVSQSTLSMVLPRVSGARLSAQTRVRVLAAAVGLGYRLAQRQAEPLVSGDVAPRTAAGHCRLIGDRVDEISTGPHPVLSIDGARHAAWARGCLLQVAVTGHDAEQEAAAIAALRAQPALLGIACINGQPWMEAAQDHLKG